MSLDFFLDSRLGFFRLLGALPQSAEAAEIGASPRQTFREPLRAVHRLEFFLLHYFWCKNVTIRH